ncbi:tetratricopeptide repeat protein, partial [Cytophagia bacterium CHB2]|nr:tetratricopeptide repeat protein [Cytophagia bacterium CHB2]
VLHRKSRGENHWLVAYALNSLATMFYEKGDFAAAIPVYKNAIAIYSKAWKTPNQRTGSSLLGLAAALTENGNAAEAEPLARKGLQIFRDSMAAGHWQVARAESVLGGCLLALHKFDEAEPLLLSGYETLKVKRGDDDALTRRTRALLYQLYRAIGKAQQAAQFEALP